MENLNTNFCIIHSIHDCSVYFYCEIAANVTHHTSSLTLRSILLPVGRSCIACICIFPTTQHHRICKLLILTVHEMMKTVR